MAFTWIIYFITVFQIFFLSGVGLTIFGVGRTSSEFFLTICPELGSRVQIMVSTCPLLAGRTSTSVQATLRALTTPQDSAGHRIFLAV